jgi:hypothetical protein
LIEMLVFADLLAALLFAPVCSADERGVLAAVAVPTETSSIVPKLSSTCLCESSCDNKGTAGSGAYA